MTGKGEGGLGLGSEGSWTQAGVTDLGVEVRVTPLVATTSPALSRVGPSYSLRTKTVPELDVNNTDVEPAPTIQGR